MADNNNWQADYRQNVDDLLQRLRDKRKKRVGKKTISSGVKNGSSNDYISCGADDSMPAHITCKSCDS